MMEREPAIRIIEVGPRDGLQNIARQVPTRIKIELITRLQAAGLRNIELTSAVSPKAIPQLADNEQILSNAQIRSLLSQSALSFPVLVPNKKGLSLAQQHDVKEIAVFVSATEGFSKANINCTVDEGIQRAREVVKIAKDAGVKVRGYVSCIFRDPFSGPTPETAVYHTVSQLLEMGCYEVSLGDTLGCGAAADVQRLLKYLYGQGVPASKLAGHFHDTYGQAVSNVWTAYQLGIRSFDSSVGGLGGCPYAPGAKGNIATEDLVYLFEQAGVSTGINLEQLSQVGEWISKLLQKPNDSRAGAALASKTARGLSHTTKSPSLQPTIMWTSIPTETSDLQVLRSAFNVKIIIDRPKNGNALTTSMIATLTGFFEQAATDNTISRIALTGNGKFFCTGMDLGKDSPVAQNDRVAEDQFERLTRLFKAIADAPQVTIAAINGPAFGGGVGLAFACDIRIGSADATFTLSEVKLGLAPATISKYVAREWGLAFAREAMLSGRTVPLPELRSMGVIAKSVDNAESLGNALDQYFLALKAAAPGASSKVKKLIKASDYGVSPQDRDRCIKSVFGEMMQPESESAFGLKEFQAGRRNIDWDAYKLAKSKPKL